MGMLDSFADRHRYHSLRASLRQGINKEWKLGPGLMAGKLLRDERSLFEILIPTEAEKYHKLMLEQNYKAKRPFARLESPMDYELDETLDYDRWEEKKTDRKMVTALNRNREEWCMRQKYEDIRAIKHAMDGYPGEREPGFWGRLWRSWAMDPWIEDFKRNAFLSQTEEQGDQVGGLKDA